MRKLLGQPVQQLTFPSPRPASELPELATLAKFGTEPPLTAELSGYEDYQFKGRVYAPENHAGYVMASGLTFGAGEVFMFPALMADAKRDAQRVHRFRVWYHPDHSYFVHIWSQDFWAKEIMGWDR